MRPIPWNFRLRTRGAGLRGALLAGVCAAALATVPVAPAAPAGVASDGAAPGPAAIRAAIEDEMFHDPAVRPDRVDVRVLDGVATLSGTVTNLLARERAERVASAVRGVRAVVNAIEVVPPVRLDDDELHRRVSQALFVDPATESYEIDVAATDGAVTLTGTVESWQERDLVVDVVRGVAGVVAVENSIGEDPARERADLEIAREIRRTLGADARIDERGIEVAVDDGVVRLTGALGSAAEKSLAVRKAWVLGVRRVDADALEVVSLLDDPALRNRAFEPRADGEVRQAVETALRYDPRLDPTRIDTVVRDGRVTLRGEVGDLKAKYSAADTARNAVGVVSVTNRLKVRPDETPRRSVLKVRVDDAIARDPYLEAYEIDTEVHGETVRLTGLVNSWFEKARAEDAASRVSGVARVTNLLRVDESDVPLLYDPWVDRETVVLDLPWYRYEPFRTSEPDASIREEIEDEFWWSPFVDSDTIDVRVRDGVATLTGSVESRSDLLAATENAFEGGAVWVENRIEVESETETAPGATGG